MYGKIFDSIFDSTLIEDRDATYVFMCMIVLADRDGIVDMTRPALSRRINMPKEELDAAITKLEAADPGSRHKDYDGSRIIPLAPGDRDWGWQIVNHNIYRNIASDEDRREQNRVAQQRFRDKNKAPSASVSTRQPRSDQSAQAEAEAEAKAKANTHDGSYPLEFEQVWAIYPKREGDNPKKPAYQAWSARLKDGYNEGEIRLGTERYAAYCAGKEMVGSSFVMQAKRFFGPGLSFLNTWEINHATNQRPDTSAVGRVIAANKRRAQERNRRAPIDSTATRNTDG